MKCLKQIKLNLNSKNMTTPKKELAKLGISLVWHENEMFLHKNGIEVYAPDVSNLYFAKRLYDVVKKTFNIDEPKLLKL